MFQFSGFAHLSVYYVFNIVGCPIRVSTDQFVCANPRSFSQLITPFIASESQGIPHTPLFCLLYQHSIKNAVSSTKYKYLIENAFYFLLFSYLNMSMNFKVVLSVQFLVFSRNWVLITVSWSLFLWRITESNRWPPACKAGALASWANSPIFFNYELWITNNDLYRDFSTLEFLLFLFKSNSCLGQTRTVDPYIISVVL